MLYSVFPKFESELTAEVEQKGTACSFPSGALLVNRGQSPRASYLIGEGCVKVVHEIEHGDEFVLAFGQIQLNNNSIKVT